MTHETTQLIEMQHAALRGRTQKLADLLENSHLDMRIQGQSLFAPAYLGYGHMYHDEEQLLDSVKVLLVAGMDVSTMLESIDFYKDNARRFNVEHKIRQYPMLTKYLGDIQSGNLPLPTAESLLEEGFINFDPVLNRNAISCHEFAVTEARRSAAGRDDYDPDALGFEQMLRPGTTVDAYKAAFERLGDPKSKSIP